MQSGFIEIIKRDELIIHVLLTRNLCIVKHLKNCRSISSTPLVKMDRLPSVHLNVV